MEFMLNFAVPKADQQLNHRQAILSIGSCFTEHIGNALRDYKFNVLQNPNGILFDPISVCKSLTSYIYNQQYSDKDFFQLNELWHSWHHHSRFSHTDLSTAIQQINASQSAAHQFLKEADWLIITLGSSFHYKLINEGYAPVANCHRAPAQWFQKHLLGIDEMIAALDNAIHQIFHFNKKINIIFTISPVRHIRDGVVDNNRSKARLLEVVHHLVNKFNRLYYFPSYEIVIDILRDYRFYDVDMVHPNYLATEYVLNQFVQAYMNEQTLNLIKELKSINIAYKHRPSHAQTTAHQKFLKSHLQKVEQLQQQHPYLDFAKEIKYFSKGF
jgi:hypothetical protein